MIRAPITFMLTSPDSLLLSIFRLILAIILFIGIANVLSPDSMLTSSMRMLIGIPLLAEMNIVLMWVTLGLTVVSGINYLWKNRAVLSDMK